MIQTEIRTFVRYDSTFYGIIYFYNAEHTFIGHVSTKAYETECEALRATYQLRDLILPKLKTEEAVRSYVDVVFYAWHYANK